MARRHQLATASRYVCLALLACLLIYFVLNVLACCATFATTYSRALLENARNIQVPLPQLPDLPQLSELPQLGATTSSNADQVEDLSEEESVVDSTFDFYGINIFFYLSFTCYFFTNIFLIV